MIGPIEPYFLGKKFNRLAKISQAFNNGYFQLALMKLVTSPVVRA